MIVFDRWGSVVYQKKDHYDNSWDGKDLKGHNLPVESYHYMIMLDGKVVCRGIVTIIR